jgi:uncharacterized membrane protein YuzA (DUF378 family)
MENSDNNEKSEKIVFSALLVGVTFTTIISAATEAIVGFIAVYFFAPLWHFIVKKISKNKKEKNEPYLQ